MKTFNEWVEQLNEAKKAKKEKPAKSHKKDVTGDGKANFDDVMASRMIASGMSKEEAIKKAHHHADKHKKKK